MKALCWHGKSDMRYETVPDPKILDPARRHHQGDRLRHLWLGSAHLQRCDPRDGKRGRDRPRDHGRGRGGRARQHQAQGRRPRRGAVSQSLAANASSASAVSIRDASGPTQTPKRPRSCGVIRRRACLATRTCWAATPAARRNTCVCRLPMLARSRCLRDCPTTRCCSSPTSFRPATWLPTSATFRMATSSPSGVADRLASSRSEARFCLARAG